MTSHQNGHPLRNGLINQAGKKRRTSDELPSFLGNYIPVLPNGPVQGHPSSSRLPTRVNWNEIWRRSLGIVGMLRSWRPRDLLGIPLALIIIWWVVLWWGEEVVFRHSVENCVWSNWESWPATSTPHHVALIADPQLVDPHTYPGRPWPLSTLTVRYTDLYIRKSFQQIQSILAPGSVFFLGDLFDGGREWSTGEAEGGKSVDKRWRKYDNRFWLKEYKRFARIFFNTWLRGGQGQNGRKMVAGLPGNHDLGLGNGIRLPVRKRFQAYFGNGNRIDIVGNHTFVSLDTVSLSAKGQPDPATGSQGIDESNKDIWGPVEQFLHTAKGEKARTIARELRVRYGKNENEIMNKDVIDLEEPRAWTIPLDFDPLKSTDIPSIILTHVPLYRAPGTPCGPLRERYPPSRTDSGEAPEKDDANAIAIQQGVQYQNVLTHEISKELVELVGDVSHIFSGDDHDYCDVIHRGYTSKNGGIREVTVKSISWAMGVRKPGFLLLSLWNPVDEEGKANSQDASKSSTIQSHLCLLPDQLSIFIRYGLLLAFTLVVLFVRAVRIAYGPTPATSNTNGSLLPLSKIKPAPTKQQDTPSHASSSSTSSQNGLAVRPSAGPRNVTPGSGYGYQPPTVEDEAEDESPQGVAVNRTWNDIALDEPSRRKRRKGLMIVYDEFSSSVLNVGVGAMVWYIWLLWHS
ncbi:hypothetical protein HO133_004206 [Letharia lupina]|uniref:Calcineurin-like phosphoesterase domain-containing protein n=1 Tax=Letharia lupina TaxID=560253 RepID=A0A8H6FJT1_9LECA|nr:uncharacterized protein HO133_004206 [Letharia lupina]KAF6229869.1 hypothetical protein HO133_004206 [Letharia lupina]